MITIWDVILWLSGFFGGAGVMFVSLVYLGKRLDARKRRQMTEAPHFQPMRRKPFPEMSGELVEFRKGDHG